MHYPPLHIDRVACPSILGRKQDKAASRLSARRFGGPFLPIGNGGEDRHQRRRENSEYSHAKPCSDRFMAEYTHGLQPARMQKRPTRQANLRTGTQ